MLVEALPRITDALSTKNKFVKQWFKRAKVALLNKRKRASMQLLDSRGLNNYWHLQYNASSGVYIVESKQTVGNPSFIYAWDTEPMGITEALAYLFDPKVRGVIQTIFFTYMLPKHKTVITDSLYTDDGHRWFQAQYNYAFQHSDKYTPYTLDLTQAKPTFVELATQEDFYTLDKVWWGNTELHEKYRFAIRQKS